ncbi:MAG: phage holin family protein [Microbacterium sp.]|uniref:phage holin family protein n=1 Tax=Microbacterium sp. TaxID=51671 RepID=UPI001ACEDF5E|nr:phage holin family protein [Microbacterium sp.]MBN9154567.1 phage holin family protein [Microbacterium sp.]MBN9173416.1 phage holin family protein [Microbacterium sp.]MBN9185129.1 phage holin family protein [Microbacterium sp.]MBN9195151.1 phage holin family protein [Microbacterium sp.]
MTTPRGFRDRADDSFLTLVGDLPELIRNLVVAEIEHAKNWVKGAAKDAGFGTGWMVVALFFLFWSIPVFGTFVIAGLSSWWPVWLSAIVVFGVMIVITAVLALLGILRFRHISKSQNPVGAVKQDVKIVKDVTDEF